MRFRKITASTQTAERPGSKRFRLLLFPSAILGACALVAAGVFAVRALTADDSGNTAWVPESAGAEAAIGEVLDRGQAADSSGEETGAPPSLSAADLESLSVEGGPPLDELLAASGDSGQVEKLAADCTNFTVSTPYGTSTTNNITPPQESPFCADGLPIHGGAFRARTCADWTAPVGFAPKVIYRWPGYSTNSTMTIGGPGGSGGAQHSEQWVGVQPRLALLIDGQWKFWYGDWFFTRATFVDNNASNPDSWWTLRDGQWVSGTRTIYDLASRWGGGGPAGGVLAPMTAVRIHPGHPGYHSQARYYWGPILDNTGNEVFKGWLSKWEYEGYKAACSGY